jgi:hypothetical protein
LPVELSHLPPTQQWRTIDTRHIPGADNGAANMSPSLISPSAAALHQQQSIAFAAAVTFSCKVLEAPHRRAINHSGAKAGS